MHALGGLQIDHGDVNAPGHPGVRDYMLRYMAEIFVGGQFGPIFGQVAGWIVTGVFGFLLLSAVNTAIVDLIAISFLMSRDGELPPRFEKLNGFGVPNLGLIVATIIPAILVVAVKDIAGLAELYPRKFICWFTRDWAAGCKHLSSMRKARFWNWIGASSYAKATVMRR
jgi:amino acid transporter